MSEYWKGIAKRSRDVQYEEPGQRLEIKMVGIRGFSVPVSKFSRDNLNFAMASVNAFVDLPEKMRGINMSRTAVSISSAVSSVSKIEELASMIALKLLEVHEYSLRSVVKLKGEGFIFTKSPVTGLESIERFGFFEISKIERGKIEENIIGTEVTGISACPCGAELMRTKLNGIDVNPTHMQRAEVKVALKVSGKYFAKFEELIDIAYRSLSERAYSSLKRADEAFLIYSSLKNTKFVEDIYRSAVSDLYQKFKDMNGISGVFAMVRSMESIHGYDAVASGWLNITAKK